MIPKTRLDKIKKLLREEVDEISSLKKTPKLFESTEYPIMLHRKQIFKQILEIIEQQKLI
jgi:hypothetical protein